MTHAIFLANQQDAPVLLNHRDRHDLACEGCKFSLTEKPGRRKAVVLDLRIGKTELFWNDRLTHSISE